MSTAAVDVPFYTGWCAWQSPGSDASGFAGVGDAGDPGLAVGRSAPKLRGADGSGSAGGMGPFSAGGRLAHKPTTTLP